MQRPKITLSGYIKILEKDLAVVLAEMPTHIALTHQEVDCLVFI